MDQLTTTLPDSVETDAAERSLLEDLRLLADDGRALAKAEAAYQQSRAKLAGGSIGKIAAFGGAALVLVFLAVMGLVLGLILALTPLITAWGATAVVVVLLLVLAGVALMMAKSRWQRLSRFVAESGPLG